MKTYKTNTKSISQAPAANSQAAHRYPPQSEPQLPPPGTPPSSGPPPQATKEQPLGLTKPAILAYVTVTEDADFSEIRRALGALQGEGSVSDEALFDFLAMVLPDDTAMWTERLQNRVARYATWPTGTFTIVGRRDKVRIRVENRVVVDVTPHENQPL